MTLSIRFEIAFLPLTDFLDNKSKASFIEFIK